MRILVVFSAALALAVAKPTVVHYSSPLQGLFVNQDASGGYSFGYSGDTSSKSESRTSDGSTKGSYSYVDANGVVQQVSYEADDVGGFRVAASNLPVAGAAGAAAAAAAAASATPYTGPVYKGPKANHQLGVPPPETPEVVAAKAEHFAAKAAAEAAATGSGAGFGGLRYGSAGAAGLGGYSGLGGASGLSGLSGLSGVSGYSALGSSGYYGAGYAAGSQGGYQGPKANHQLGVPPADTPEVSAARAEHLATVAAVASRDQAAAQFGAGSLAGLGAGVGAGVGAGLGAGVGAGVGAGARYGAGAGFGSAGLGAAGYGASAYSGSGAFGGAGSVGGYQGPKANHVLGQPPMDTPEVNEARKQHFIAKAAVEARDQAAGSGAGFGVGSAFGAGAGAGYGAGVGAGYGAGAGAGFGAGSGLGGYAAQAYAGQGAFPSSSFRNPDPGVIAPSVPVADTPEVAAEKQRHLTLVEQAKIASLSAVDDSAQHDDGSYKPGVAGGDDGQYRESAGYGAFGGAAQFDDGSYKGEGLAAGAGLAGLAGLAGSGKVITPASTSLTGGAGGYSAGAYASGAGAYGAGAYSAAGRQGAAGRGSITPASTTLTSAGGASGLFAGSSVSGGRGLSYSFSAPVLSKTYLPPVSSGYSQYHSQDGTGQYTYGYAGKLSSNHESRTSGGVTRGSYSYVDTTGQVQSVSYISDAQSGFKVSGTNIPSHRILL